MTARDRYQSHALLMYSALSTGVALVVAGAVVRLVAPAGLGAAVGIFLGAWAVLCTAAIWPGAWVCDAAGRRFDRNRELPPPGGMIDGHTRPESERIHP